MEHDDIVRIHQRIDAVGVKQDATNAALSELTAAVRENLALCTLCRPKVMGNGHDPMDTRLARVEDAQIWDGEKRLTALESTLTVSRWWIGTLIATAGAAGGIASAIVRYCTGHGQ